MWSDIESQTIEAGELTLKIRHVYDENPDHSHLGKYASKLSNFTVDRNTGVLYGEDADEPEPEEFGVPEDDWYPTNEDEPNFSRWAAYERAWDEWDDRHGCVELASCLSSNFGRGEFQYFDVNGNHLPHNEKNWGHVEGVEKYWEEAQRKLKARHIDTGDKRYDLDVLYTCQDYERMVELEKNYWWYIAIIVEVHLKGTKVGHAALWGVESDSGGYIEEITKELTDEAIEDANLTLHDMHAFDAVAGFAALREATEEELDA